MNHQAATSFSGITSLLQRIGLPADFRTFGRHAYEPGSRTDSTLVVSSVPGESEIPVLLLPVGSVQELKQKVGRLDTDDDSHIDYPDPVPERLQTLLHNAASKRELLAGLEEADKSLLRKASIAYMMGNTAKLTGYEALLNAALFPGQLALAVGEELDVVKADRILISGSDFMVFGCGKLLTGNGVTVDVHSDSQINIGYLGAGGSIVAGTATGNVFNYTGPAYDKPAAQGVQGGDGDKGNKGTDGTTQYNSGTCKYECKQPPSDGASGCDGGIGGKGDAGLKGNPGISGTLELGAVEGDLTINAGGGTGQQGGRGGKGGTGGPGGDPGIKPGECSTGAKQGPQGRGGKGGQGNDGGPGGDPCTVLVYYSSVSGQIYTNGKEGVGGTAGKGGEPGEGNGNNGEGLPGNNGTNSKASTIKATQL